MHFNRSGKNSGLEYVRELAHLPSGALERLLLRDVIDAQHLWKPTDVLHRGRDRFYVGAVGEEGANLDALLHLIKRLTNVDRNQPEESEREQREGDRDDSECAQKRCAPGSRQRFAGRAHLESLRRFRGGVADVERLVEWPRRRRRFGGVEDDAAVIQLD